MQSWYGTSVRQDESKEIPDLVDSTEDSVIFWARSSGEIYR
jgi:hypothetical protein